MKRTGAALLALCASMVMGISFPASAATDTDGDGVPDAIDNCAVDANPRQTDLDLDGLGGPCDLDRDGDSILNAFPDNCPDAPNVGQADDDGDLVGDVCDALAASLQPTGNISVAGFQPAGVAGANVDGLPLVETFQIVLQRINLQRRVRLSIGFVDGDGERRYHKITRAYLKNWPPSLSKTVVTTSLSKVNSMSAGDSIVVTVGHPRGELGSAADGFFTNSIMAGKLKKFL